MHDTIYFRFFFFSKRRAFAYFYHCKYSEFEEILCFGNHVAVKQKVNKEETLKIKFLYD